MFIEMEASSESVKEERDEEEEERDAIFIYRFERGIFSCSELG